MKEIAAARKFATATAESRCCYAARAILQGKHLVYRLYREEGLAVTHVRTQATQDGGVASA